MSFTVPILVTKIIYFAVQEMHNVKLSLTVNPKQKQEKGHIIYWQHEYNQFCVQLVFTISEENDELLHILSSTPSTENI